MKAALRALAAVLAGLVASFVLIVALELFSAAVHPPPENFGGTPEEMDQFVRSLPP
jgi:hypothetical protein